ncbi:50S ribosomal protein L22 [Candidatus Peregrinibacteria bacterium]|nr:50S ribosomal protein L22 [Candidatus Peregrinibacteria bacterium]
MKAIARHQRISSKKANLVAGLVRGQNAENALAILKHTPKKAAHMLYKVIKSAVSNAENNFKQKKDNLLIKEIVVTEGPTLKRSIPISRGRMHPILKRTAHISVTVGLAEGEKTEAKEKVKAVKTEKAEEPATQVRPIPPKKTIAKKITKKKEPRQSGTPTTKS